MITQGAVTLTGARQVIPITIDTGGGANTSMLLANESYFALQVQVAGNIKWLQPWTADLFEIPQVVTTLVVTPSILISPTPPNLSSVLLITLAEPGERIPGNFPMALSRQTAPFQPGVPLAQLTTGTTVTQNVVLPAGTQSVTLLLFQSPGAIGATGQVKVVGHNTGFTYLAETGGALSFWVANNPLSLAIAEAYDLSLDITLAPAGAGAGVVTLYVQGDLASRLVAVSPQQVALTNLLDPNGLQYASQATQASWASNQSFLPAFPVSQLGTQAPLWAAARVTAEAEGPNLAANGTVTVVAGSVGQSIFVFGGRVVVGKVAGGNDFHTFVLRSSSVADSGASGIVAVGMGQTTDGIRDWPFQCNGAQLVQGDGLLLKNLDTVSHDYWIQVAYAQG